MLSTAYKMLYFSLQELLWLYYSHSEDVPYFVMIYTFNYCFLLPESLLKAVEQTL